LDDDDSLEDAKDSGLAGVIQESESRRYLSRSPIYRKGNDRITQDLDLNDEETDNCQTTNLGWSWSSSVRDVM